jgi:hypothetical protein
MGKSIPIMLPNGRSWPTKSAAAEHFREMLGRYVVGERVLDEADHSDLEALLTVYDGSVAEDEPTKADVGIAYFEKDKDVDHPGKTKCFFVVRVDGSRIDFSLGRALDAASQHRSIAASQHIV